MPHPAYPTSACRLGFTDADSLGYAPEHLPEFELRWVAVPTWPWRMRAGSERLRRVVAGSGRRRAAGSDRGHARSAAGSSADAAARRVHGDDPGGAAALAERAANAVHQDRGGDRPSACPGEAPAAHEHARPAQPPGDSARHACRRRACPPRPGHGDVGCGSRHPGAAAAGRRRRLRARGQPLPRLPAAPPAGRHRGVSYRPGRRAAGPGGHYRRRAGPARRQAAGDRLPGGGGRGVRPAVLVRRLSGPGVRDRGRAIRPVRDRTGVTPAERLRRPCPRLHSCLGFRRWPRFRPWPRFVRRVHGRRHACAYASAAAAGQGL